MADLLSGTVLMKRYALEHRIGLGGMASIYRAIDLTTGARVAVKVLRRDLLGRSGADAARTVDRFRSEAVILSSLKGDPYVVEYVEHGETGAGDQFIAMELLEGEQLRFTIGRGRAAMGLRTFAYYARHVVLGLKHIHARGWVHGDLAPDNIVIVRTREGLPWPKFLDFGVGHAPVRAGKGDRAGAVVGKPQYLAPEVAAGHEPTTESDVYALGVVLYEMVSGQLPFDVHGYSERRLALRDEPRPLTTWPEGGRVPPDLQDVILRCLDADPRTRPGLDELLERIERFSERLDAGEDFPRSSHEAADGAIGTGEGAMAPRGAGAPRRDFGPGDRIGRFEVRDRLASGGMGIVYLAWDPVLMREVAVKVATRVEDPESRSAILRESRAASRIRSDNVVTIFDAGWEAGIPYVAMEYVPGRTLAQVLEAEGALAPERFRALAFGIVDGLVAAHECPEPVIHRDLKPGNVLCAGAVAKLSDFGIATGGAVRELSRAARESSTSATAAKGSILTMSPEQANNKPADRRSDVYSLGCVLYMMATGRAPFQGNQIAVLYQHVTRPPEAPLRLNPDLPSGVGAIILKCMEKDPALRYQSVREVRADLERAFRSARGVAVWQRSPLLFASLAALAFTVVAIVFALTWGPRAGIRGDVALVRVAGTPVSGGSPTGETWSRAPHVDVEATVPDGGDVRATVAADWMQEPWVRVFQVGPEAVTRLRIPLPESHGQDPERFTVTLDRPGAPRARPASFVVLQDVHEPTVTFRCYGAFHEASTLPLRVVRVDDVRAVVEDPGGLDDAGVVSTIDLAWNESQPLASFTAARREADSASVWIATIVARDRAGNPTRVSQTVEVAGIDVEVRKPDVGVPTNQGVVAVDVVARLLDRTRPILGLDENDLDLAPGSLEARIVVGSRPSEPVAMARVHGGYAADLAIPKDAPPECEIEVEVLLDRECVARSRLPRDARAPVITVAAGDAVVASSAAPATPSMIDAGGLAGAPELACRIDDGPAGLAGARVEVQVGGAAPVAVPIGTGGEVRLPPLGPGETRVRVEGTDRAGNVAALVFSVRRRGPEVASIRFGDVEPDGEDRVFITGSTVSLRVVATGASEEDRAFAHVLDAEDALIEAVPLLPSDGEPGVFEAHEVPVFGEGSVPAAAKLRVAFGASPAAALAGGRRYRLIRDREPPTISVTADGFAGEVGRTLEAGAFPALEVTIEDDAGLPDLHPRETVTWTRSDPEAPDALVVAADAATGRRGRKASFRILAPTGSPSANRFELVVLARDLAGRTAARAVTVVVTPSGATVLAIAGRADVAGAGPGWRGPLAVNDDVVVLKIRPPVAEYGPCTLLVRAAADGGGEVVRRFALDGAAGGGAVDLLAPLPWDPDGARIQRGAITARLDAAGRAGGERLLDARYVIDREPPVFEVRRGGVALAETERSDWIRVSALDVLRIVATDGDGAGFDDASIRDPAKAIEGFDERSAERIAFRLRDDETFRGPATREIGILLKDAAGNSTPVRLKLAHAIDAPKLRRILASDGQDLVVRGDHVVVAKPEVRIVAEPDGRTAGRLRWIVRNGSREVGSGALDLESARGDGVTGTIAWPAGGSAGGAYVVELLGSNPASSEPFHRMRVLVDAEPPTIAMRFRGASVAPGKPVRVDALNDLVLDVSDAGADVRLDSIVVSALGPAGRTMGSIVASRDGSVVRPVLFGPTPPGRYVIEVGASDRVGNRASVAFEIEMLFASPPWQRIREALAAAARPSRPPPAAVRSVTDEAVRRRDEERTGIRFVPVWDTVDRRGPPRFFMSQTEVTNSQFARFVVALDAGAVPPDLRVVGDARAIRKRIQESRFRPEDAVRAPHVPVIGVDPSVARAFAAWTGGRLPSRDEWVGAAGRYLLDRAQYPVYVDRGTPRSGTFWMQDARFSDIRRGPGGPSLAPVTELLRDQATAPFRIVGLAGNAAEWVTLEPGGDKVAGTLGGSFRYPHTDEANGPRLDRAPRMSAVDAGIRVLWPAEVGR